MATVRYNEEIKKDVLSVKGHIRKKVKDSFLVASVIRKRYKGGTITDKQYGWITVGNVRICLDKKYIGKNVRFICEVVK
jgi:hypothetical protein